MSKFYYIHSKMLYNLLLELEDFYHNLLYKALLLNNNTLTLNVVPVKTFKNNLLYNYKLKNILTII